MTPKFSSPVLQQDPDRTVYSQACLGRTRGCRAGEFPSLLSPQVDGLLLDSMAEDTSSGSVGFC